MAATTASRSLFDMSGRAVRIIWRSSAARVERGYGFPAAVVNTKSAGCEGSDATYWKNVCTGQNAAQSALERNSVEVDYR